MTNACSCLTTQHYHTDINNMSRSHDVYVEEKEGFDFRLQFPLFRCDLRTFKQREDCLCEKIIVYADKMINVKIDNIVFLYSCWQPLYDKLSSLFDIKFIEGIPKSLTDENLLPPNKKSILICDDLMEVAYSNDELTRRSQNMYTINHFPLY